MTTSSEFFELKSELFEEGEYVMCTLGIGRLDELESWFRGNMGQEKQTFSAFHLLGLAVLFLTRHL